MELVIIILTIMTFILVCSTLASIKNFKISILVSFFEIYFVVNLVRYFLFGKADIIISLAIIILIALIASFTASMCSMVDNNDNKKGGYYEKDS